MSHTVSGASSGPVATVPTVISRNPLLGFGKVTTRVTGMLAAMFVLSNTVPGFLRAVALVPANTLMVHFFIWNFFTASFVEVNFFGAATACGVTLLMGKQLEPLWGSRELIRFILVVSITGGLATFFTSIFLFAVSAGYMYEQFLDTPIFGYAGMIGGYLIAVKQLLPEQQNTVCGAVKVKSRDLAPIYVVLYTTFYLLGLLRGLSYLLMLYETFFAWVYLRFFQPRKGGVVGDQHNEDFAFVEFFPKHPLVRGFVVTAATGCFRLMESFPCCKTVHVQKRNTAKIVQHAALPGHTQTEAERYRTRALELLDQKLAAAGGGGGGGGGTAAVAADAAGGDVESGGGGGGGGSSVITMDKVPS
jgi:membrane associated rhomboid family serine protease